MLQAFQNKRILKNILSNLMDKDIMNLNYVSKGINMAIRGLKHYEKIPSESLYITLHIQQNSYTYKSVPEKFDPTQVSKITFNFLLLGLPFQYENFIDEYYIILKKICTDINMLFLQNHNNLHIKIQSYYHFFEKFIISFIGSIICNNNVKLDIDIKPYNGDFNFIYPYFIYPKYNMFEGFKNINSITIRSNFDKGIDVYKYFFQCLPNNNSFKININFIEYLNEKQWENVKCIINSRKWVKIKIGINCWGEDGSFWHYIPNAITTDFLKNIYRFEVNGDSFNILRKFKSLFIKMVNLKTLVCNFHVYEYVIKSFNQLSKNNFEKMNVYEEIKNLKNLTSVNFIFNYIYDFNQNNEENLMAIDYTFNKLLESLPSSITKLSVTGIRSINVNLAEKMNKLLPNLIYLNISKVNHLDENFLMKMPNIRFIVSHACQPVKIPTTISVCGTFCCINPEPIECVKFFKTYWKYCYCKQYHKAWKKSIRQSKRYRKLLKYSTDYNMNIFYNEIKDGWNVLKVFDEEYFNNMYKDIYYRTNIA
ncbi:Hypothetical protein SRAE_2000442800 [Strongyloides ratti]|uniref:F-box domain-containing protein n=1 Tax=Strongyloides ratti TaxID=34506 RepID=A0A090LJ00_STRRB|nr:Hypothetical protein SRAE_2000442800 [Strongyloides ratti]CEF69782.1 Hypothetical protein SRAE_2000442800 [Strongyloides ratti]